MCGIAGFTLHAGEHDDASRKVLADMVQTLIHRGPDDEGLYCDSAIALGCRRLSIIDIEGGHQPLFNEDKSIVLVCNGEIYNYQEIRAKLINKGHKFSSHSDCEVIIHLYEDEGLDFVSHIEGMFAICLWDRKKERLILVRDRMGIKPLYYLWKKGVCAFASELKALVNHPQFTKSINSDALNTYFMLNYIPYPLTIYTDVFKLPPAHMLVAEKGKISITCYWDTRAGLPSNREMDEAEWIHTIREAFWASVEKMLMSEVPLGVLLSGGIDSSGIVAALAMLGDNRVPTFSVVFKNLPGYDEDYYSTKVAQYFKTNHTVLNVQADSLEYLEQVICQMDEPVADKALIPTWLIFKEATKNVKVVLSGEGADELFLGYSKYRYLHFLPDNGVPFLSCLKPVVRNHRRLHKLLSLATMPFSVEKAIVWDRVFLEEEQNRIFSHSAPWTAHFDLPLKNTRSLRELIMAWDLFYFLPENLLMKVDKLSMAHGVEARVPYLDVPFLKQVLRVPMKVKLAHGASKYLLRKMFTGILPDEILNRPKHGFTLPVKEWLRDDAAGLVSRYLSPSMLEKSPYLQNQGVQSIINAHKNGRDYTRQIWNLLTWQIWASKNGVIDGA